MTRGWQLTILALAMAAGGYVRTTVSPLQEAIRVALSLSDNQMAIVQGLAMGLPMALVALPLGVAIDRYSRVRLLLGLTILSVVGTILSAAATGFMHCSPLVQSSAGLDTEPFLS